MPVFVKHFVGVAEVRAEVPVARGDRQSLEQRFQRFQEFLATFLTFETVEVEFVVVALD